MSKSFKIPDNYSTSPPVFDWRQPWLAPLAGYTDLPFRMLCRHYGAAVTYTEMISAMGLKMSTQPTADLLLTTTGEDRLIVQLFGSDVETMRCATAILRKSGRLWFDCNMGCPAKKVIRQGAGSRLLENPQYALTIARAMIEEAAKVEEGYLNPGLSGKIGFKLRLGFEFGKNIMPDMALRLEDIGAAWITLHPRYGKQGFTGEADWREIEKLSKRLSIPVMASGDLLTGEAGLACLRQTGASGIMYARGALYNPAIFRDHRILTSGDALPQSTRQDLCETMLLHIDFARTHYASERGFYKIRSILPRYVRFHSGVGKLRNALVHCHDWNSLINEVQLFMEN